MYEVCYTSIKFKKKVTNKTSRKKCHLCSTIKPYSFYRTSQLPIQKIPDLSYPLSFTTPVLHHEPQKNWSTKNTTQLRKQGRRKETNQQKPDSSLSGAGGMGRRGQENSVFAAFTKKCLIIECTAGTISTMQSVDLVYTSSWSFLKKVGIHILTQEPTSSWPFLETSCFVLFLLKQLYLVNTHHCITSQFATPSGPSLKLVCVPVFQDHLYSQCNHQRGSWALSSYAQY